MRGCAAGPGAGWERRGDARDGLDEAEGHSPLRSTVCTEPLTSTGAGSHPIAERAIGTYSSVAHTPYAGYGGSAAGYTRPVLDLVLVLGKRRPRPRRAGTARTTEPHVTRVDCRRYRCVINTRHSSGQRTGLVSHSLRLR